MMTCECSIRIILPSLVSERHTTTISIYFFEEKMLFKVACVQEKTATRIHIHTRTRSSHQVV